MDYSSAVKKIKAGLNQQSSSRTSSGSTSSAVENIKKGISYHRGARDFGFDTLGADIEALNNTINSAYKGWQPSDKMQSAKATLKSMYERLQKYQEHRKRYGGEDLSELLNYYKTASENWDSLSKTYGNYKNMFEYEREKNKIAELNSMSSAELLEKIKPKTISEMTPQERFTAQNLIPTGAIYDHDVAYTTADGTKIKWEDLISNARDRETRASADFGKFVESGKGVSSSEIGTTERRAVGRGRLANTPKVNSDLREFALALERKTNGETSSNSTSYYDTASVFDKMTDKEVEMAYYYIGLDKKQGNKDYFHTENYMKSLMDSLNARRSVDIAEMVEDKPWGEFGFSIEAGLDQWSSGMKGLTEENIPTSPIQYASGIVRENVEEDYGKFARTMYDFGVTGANMLPSIGVATMLSAIAPELAVGSLASKAMTGISKGAGLATMGASVKGNAYQEMLDLGYDKEQATTYSNLVAASEVGLEYLMGGIGKLGGTSAKVSKAVSQIDNGLARFAIQFPLAMASEGAEEGLQEILTPMWQRIATGESESVDWGEVAYSALLGGLMGGMYAGPGLAISTVSETARTKAIGQDIKANDRVADVFDLANNPEIASAYEAYNRYAKKGITAENASDGKLGRLYGMAYTDAQGILDAKTSTMAQKDSAQGIIDNLEAYASRSMSSTLSDGTKGIVATDKSDATTKLVTGAKGIAETENSDMHKDADYVSALVESGLESAEGTEAHTLATEYSQKLKDGKKVSAKEVANLQNALDKEIRAEEVKAVKSYLKENGHDVALAEAVTRQARGEAITEAEAEAIEDSGIDIAKVEDAIVEYDGTATETETSEVAEASSEVSIPTEKIEELGLSPETVNVVERKAEGKGITISEAENLIKNEDALNVLADNGNEELVNLVKTITDEEGVDKATLFLSLYDGKTDIESFSKAFNLAVTKSEDNFPFDNIRATKGVLSDEQVKKIYAEVRIKADKSKRASFQKLVDKTAKMKAYKGVVDDSVIDYENKSTKGKVNWNSLPDATRKAVVFFKGLAKATGMNLTFITDGKARGFNGEFSVDGNTITIDLFAKHLDFESGDIIESIVPSMSHELTHWMEKKAPILFRKVSDIVFSTLEKEDGITEWDRIANEIKRLTNKGELKETDSESKKAERARSEIVARACEGMLSQSKVGKEMFNSLSKTEKKTLIDKVKDIVKDILNWIEEALGIYKPTSYEAQMLMKYKSEYEKLSKLWDKMLIESAEVNQALEKSGAFRHEVKSIGSRDLSDFSEAVGTDGEKLFQHRAMVEDEDIYRAMLLKHKDTIGISNKQINELFATIDKAVDIISENLEALDYAWDVDINDRAFSPVKPNSDSLYKVSLDFSTLCRKRLLQQTIAQTLQNALDKNLSTEESIAIRDELLKVQEEGRKIEVACALCYVESARMKSPKQINKFLNGREAIIKEFFANRSGGSIKEKIANAEMKARKALAKANPDGYYGKNDVKLDVLTAPKSHMKKADADYIRNEGKKAKASYKLTEHEQAELDSAMKMSVDDFTSAKGLENLAKNHPDLFDAYTSFVRNATHSKGIENDTWWRAGDSESIGDSLIAKMNEENGLRSQSWSDFQVIHLLDYIAATIELSTKGAKRQSYTKVPDYVKLLGNTGDMINMSLIPARVFNGKLEYDSVEGMAYDIAKQLRDEYHETVGTICIGINNEQIQMLLDDITIDMVIPYHHSSMSKAVRKLMHIPAWETYQNYQGEKNLSDAEAKARAKEYGVKLNKDSNYQKAPNFSEWFNLEEARQIAKLENANPSDMDAYKKYGKMYGGYMAMRNAANKYLKLCAERGLAPKFSSEKADFTHDANYWKLLIDRKMVDNVTGEIIEQKAIKPIFNEKHVLEILTDELKRYPEVKADQEYATRVVTEKFLSGEMKVDKSTLEAIKKPIDNVTKVNILESSGEVLHSERVDAIEELTDDDYKTNCKELIQMSSVASLKGNELDGDLPLVEKVATLFSQWGNNIYTDKYGNIALPKSSIRSERRHGHTREKVIAYAAIPQVLQNGVAIDVYNKNHGEVKRIIVAAPITIDGTPYFMGVMLQRDANVNRLYLHDVVIKKETSQYQTEHLNTTGPVDTENLYMTEVLEKAISVGYSISNQDKNVNTLLSESDSEGNNLSEGQIDFFKESKARDDDGNLLPLYHGTPNGSFTEFRLGDGTHSTLMAAYGAGYYFDSVEASAKRYTKSVNKTISAKRPKVYKVYLNVTNPLEITDGVVTISKEQLAQIISRGNYQWFFTDGMPFSLRQRLGKTKEEIQKMPRKELINHWSEMIVERAYSDADILSEMVRAYKGDSILSAMKDILEHDGAVYRDKYGEVWVAWDSNQIKSTDNTNPTSNPDIRHSERADLNVYDLMGEAERLNAENAKLDADAEKLKGILGTEEVANRRFLALANYIKKISGSAMDSAKLGKKLKTTYTSMQSFESLTWESIASLTDSIAESVMNNDLGVSSEYFKKVMFEIRKDKISLSKEQRARVEERFGSYGNFHKYVFGRINVTNDGKPLSEIWGNWSKLYPSLFDAKADGAEQIDALLDAVDALKATSTIMGEYEHQEAIRHLSTEIYNQFWNIATDSATVEEAQVYRTEHKALMTELRKDYEQRQKDLAVHPTGESALKYESLLRKFKETKRKEIAKAKEHGREMMDKYKENAERKTKIQSITSVSLSLNEMLVKNSKDKHVPEIMREPVTALLQAIDFSSKRMLTKGEPTNKDISLSKALGKVKDMMVKATNAHEELVELYGHGLDEDIEKMVDSVDNIMRTVGDNEFVLNTMSLEDLKTLDKMVKTIRHAVNKLNKFHTVNHAKGIANLSMESVSYLDSLGKGNVYDGKRGAVSKLLNWGNALPYYVFKRYGSGGMKVYEALQDGWDKFAFNTKQILDYANEAYTSKEVNEWSEEVKTFKILLPANEFELANPDYVPRYQEVQLTVPQIMSMYCLNKREQARGHLFKGGIRVADFKDHKGKIVSQTEGVIFTEKDISNILNSLTDRQKTVADKLQLFMNTASTDWGNEVSMARFGYKAFGEENYFPIQSDKNNLAVNDETEQNNSLFKLLNMSFTKSTIEDANNRIVISDIFDVFAQHTSDMAKYNALALPVLDAFKWYNFTEKQDIAEGTFKTKGVKQSIENAFGKDGQNYFVTFLKDINGQQEVSRDTLGKGFFSNAKIAAVGANLRVVALQPTSYARASAVIDNKYLTKALVHKPKIAKAETYCGIALWKSMGYYDTNIQRGVEAQIKHADTWKDKAIDISMKGAEMADKITWGYLWNACELEIRDTRKDLKVGSKEFYEAIGKRLREVIYATQVVDSTMTRSQMMRSSDRGDKFLTAFASEPTLSYNMLQDAYMEYSLDKRRMGKAEAIKKNGKRIGRIVLAYTMTNAIAALVESAFDALREDDDEEMDMLAFLKMYFKNFALDMSIGNKIPFVKEAYSAIQGFSASRTDAQWMEEMTKALTTWYKIFNGKGKPSTAIKYSIKAISDISGLPFYNVYRDIMATLNKLDIFTVEDLNEMFEDFID